MNSKTIVYDRTYIKEGLVENDVYQNRTNAAMQYTAKPQIATVSIAVVACNCLDKTKLCLEALLKYTADIDFELILIDQGSKDKTLEYFENFEYDKKTVIHYTKNGPVDLEAALSNSTGKYFMFLANDIIVTKNWLKNLIACIESDNKIGMVVPATCNVSNRQEVSLCYSSPEEMQEMAEKYNVFDPCKREERIRLITLAPLFRRECILAIGGQLFDPAFVHDCGDDDLSFRIRRAGYKLIYAADTWVCHNHTYDFDDDTNGAQSFLNRFTSGVNCFKQKYDGIDLFSGAIAPVGDLEKLLVLPANTETQPNILGIDCLCGEPILQVKNFYRKNNIFNGNYFALCSDAMYYSDLKSICNGDVYCTNEYDFINCFAPNSFDCIVAATAINLYSDLLKVLQAVFAMLKTGGQAVIKLKNTSDCLSLLSAIGFLDEFPSEFYTMIAYKDLIALIESLGGGSIRAIKFENDIPKNILDNPNNSYMKIFNSLKNITDDANVNYYIISFIKNF